MSTSRQRRSLLSTEQDICEIVMESIYRMTSINSKGEENIIMVVNNSCPHFWSTAILTKRVAYILSNKINISLRNPHEEVNPRSLMVSEFSSERKF
jgi:hypothetical protein